jgi:predicted nucleotidyltransferase
MGDLRLPPMTFDELLARCEADARVVGVFLGGSRGKDAHVRPESDYDVRVVVEREDAELLRSLESPRGGEVDAALSTLAQFRPYALAGSITEWDRYTFTRGRVLVDKLDGDFQRLVDEKARLSADEANLLARNEADGYMNSLHRSLKSGRLGLGLAARLHAAESVAHLLAAVFALEERVRPFHDALTWELEAEPLHDWSSFELLVGIEAALSGEGERQQALFRTLEPRLRARGLGDVVDAWEPDVALMRGAA